MRGRSADIEFAAETIMAYGLAETKGSIDVLPVEAGYVNHVHKATVNDGRTYAVRTSDRLTVELLENENAIVDQLSMSGLKTAVVMRDQAGKFLHCNQDKRSAVVTWLEGQHPDDADIQICKALGGALATFHMVVKYLPHPNNDQLLSSNVREWVETNLQMHGSTIEELKEDALKFNDQDLSVGIVHGDFHAHNALIDANTIAVIDFERSGEGILLLDIARSVADLCVTNGRLDSHKLTAFLEGYKSVKTLTSKEYSMLKPAISYAALAVANWFHVRGEKTWTDRFLRVGKSVLENPTLVITPHTE
jgi:homoserine kinase type II